MLADVEMVNLPSESMVWRGEFGGSDAISLEQVRKIWFWFRQSNGGVHVACDDVKSRSKLAGL